MKRTLLFIACVLASLASSAQGNDADIFDYFPFVEVGKRWHVACSNGEPSYHFNQFMIMDEEVVKAGKTYRKMVTRSEDDFTVVGDAELLREEDRKVYIFDADMQTEHLVFDYSLKAGETYETYSYDEQKVVTYKVLSVDEYTEGPEAKLYYYETADSTTMRHRLLQKWTVCRTDDDSCQKTWIECVGSLEGPLANLYDASPVSSMSYLAYVDYAVEYAISSLYLPFSFYDTLNRSVHGCNLPIGASDHSGDWRHQLTYDLEGENLHVYGKAFTNCGPNSYAYFVEEPTDDPLTHKLRFMILVADPVANCMALHATNFFVPGFNPNLNYIVVDNNGEEHPVINKTPQMAYRPFVADGKVWKVGDITSGSPAQCVEHFYFDGDTIINGKTCKQMMSQLYVNPDFHFVRPSFGYVGAWYEEDKKVYFCKASNNQFKLMYDFSVNANDTLLLNDMYYVIGPRQTGGMNGFKGAYRMVWMRVNGVSSYHFPWLEGVGGTDRPTTNVYPGPVDPLWSLMSCTVGDEVIYLSEGWEDGATPESMGARKRFDFTHTTKPRPTTPMRRVAEQSLYGEYSDVQLSINLDPLDEVYLVHITDDAGRAVYEKGINAGNIVGLNIDISSYENGRYTVTVENSSESFVGQIEVLTTGIEETVKNESLKDERIFNLQGQRIRTLQKGLNIVNGQKVFVK